MGMHENITDDEILARAFKQALLTDLAALEQMLSQRWMWDVTPRIGAEQEMFLVDSQLRPAPVALEVLSRLKHPRFTTEIGKFNLEANISPAIIGGCCFRRLEEELNTLTGLAQATARECGADILLAGILPTAHQHHLSLDNLTPSPRYQELNRLMTKLRGGAYNILIKGIDELQIMHDNVMPEACCTSFQVHFQVDPSNFASVYNMAQMVTAPALAAAVNSPLLLGQRLWHETRIALFQHSVDERPQSHRVRNHPARVSFGDGWVDHSAIEIFREEIARFRVIMAVDVPQNSLEVLMHGGVPSLTALRLHNGTVWRWNRPCYGVIDCRPHLRIEARAFPAGPSIVDEVANAAFFLGLLSGMTAEYSDIKKIFPFEDAKDNFFMAARHGLKAQFTWIGSRRVPAAALILDQLLPLARAGLKQSGIDTGDIDRYLGTIEERVRRDRSGSQWAFESLAAMGNSGSREGQHRCLTAAMLENQQRGGPIHTWALARMPDSGRSRALDQSVEDCMSTDLFTVRPDDLVQLAASVMDWRQISHVPVENDYGKLIGMVSHRGLLHMLAETGQSSDHGSMMVRDIMAPNPATVAPHTPILEAIELMRASKTDCLPVVAGERLVGILTSNDILAMLIQIYISQNNASAAGAA